MPSTDFVREQLADATAALAAVAREVESYRSVSDSEILELADANAMVGRLVSSNGARIAGEIARRSAPALGYQGLAQRTGHRTPEELVRVTTGQSRQEAFTAVRVGRLTTDAVDAATPDPVTGELFEPRSPWLVSVGHAVSAGTLSPAAADAIARGLGEPNDAVSVAELTSAVEGLCLLAGELDVDRLFHRARELRVELDADSVVDRENTQRAARSLKVYRQPDGMTRLVWIMDPETAAVAVDLFDRATSPRRGGPRFVSGDNADLARQITEDTRTTEQLASDVFVELLRQGSAADSSQLLGTGAPVIRLLVAQTSLEIRTGHGRLEGHPDPVSIATIERYVCSADVSPIIFGPDGQPLDVGRDERLFTKRQRKALAARDGGCMVDGCDRPPSWCEAHHIEHWARDHGRTDIADGILLCRHHHLLLHNNGWDIERDGSNYFLIPPASIDPTRTRIPMPSKSAAYRELMARVAS